MNKALVIVLSTLLVIGTVFFAAQQSTSEYQLWKQKFGFEFTAAEDLYRQMVFAHNLETIHNHNSKPNRSYNMGINQFTGLTQEQFASIYLNPKPYNTEWENADVRFQNVGVDIDWVEKKMVSPVKDQGQCGSCWAFSAVGVLQSYALMNNKFEEPLSQQQLVDCSRRYGNLGCAGGYNYQGLAYVKDHGLTTSKAYPYTAKNGGCKMDGGSFKISSVPSAKGCTGLQEAIQNRPLGVSVDANNWSPYQSGIFDNCQKQLDHDVLLVGYSDKYWKIKNSWSTSWGEQGYIRLAPGNTCGICIDKSPWVV